MRETTDSLSGTWSRIPPSKDVVLIHGMWGGGWCWDGFRQVLEDAGFRCHAPTLRHHDVDPLSPPPELGRLSLDDYARDLEQAIVPLGGRPVVVGHSMGGLLAQKLAARGVARAAVLLAPAPPRGVLALHPSVVRSFRSALLRWGFWRRPHRPTYEEAEYSFLGRLPEAERRPIYDRLVHESGRAAAEIGFAPFDRRGAARVDPDRVHCPLLVVGAELDRLVPESVARKVAARYGDRATYWRIPDRGHWLIGEAGWHDLAVRVASWVATQM